MESQISLPPPVAILSQKHCVSGTLVWVLRNSWNKWPKWSFNWRTVWLEVLKLRDSSLLLYWMWSWTEHYRLMPPILTDKLQSIQTAKLSVLSQAPFFPPQSLFCVIDGSLTIEYLTEAVFPVISIKTLVGQINRTDSKWETIMLTLSHICHMTNLLHLALRSCLITQMLMLTNAHTNKLNNAIY